MTAATSVATQARGWLRRLRAALPLAWRHDPMFRIAVVIGGVALVTLLLQAGEVSQSNVGLSHRSEPLTTPSGNGR